MKDTGSGRVRVPRPWRLRSVAVGLWCAFAICTSASAQTERHAALADLSLEDLRELRVVTVSRFEEGLDTTAASAYVITADDIRRSGARTIPEALRLAPTLDVAQADANQYAISARGFNNVLANKMLVLIDGRPVYTPLFSGVFWESQDVMLEDVERIEVVTGPSTALWGSNAVNGLIHLITKAASATRGALVAGSAGGRQRDAAGRIGGGVGATGYRLYAKTYDREDTRQANGNSVSDGARGSQTGFRADWGEPLQRVTVQGDAYRATIEQPVAERRLEGANLLGRLERLDPQGAGVTLQGFVEYARREQPGLLNETQRIADVVAQYAFQATEAQRILVGGGHRQIDDRVTLLGAVAFMPASRQLRWNRLFVQDQITLARDWTATVAASAEDNPFTGLEWLPSARLAWQPQSGTLAWASASRAVRSPSRVDREFYQPAQPPYLLAGGPEFRSEIANVFEVGWRSMQGKSFAYSTTLFYNKLKRLRSVGPGTSGLEFRNDIEGHARGLEAWMRWAPSSTWRLDAGGVLLRERLRVRNGAVDLGGLSALGNDPEHWFSLRASVDLASSFTWQGSVRRVGSRDLPAVPAYTAFDTRIAWQIHPSAEVALRIDNAFDPGHAEWGVATNRVEFERSATVQLTLRY